MSVWNCGLAKLFVLFLSFVALLGGAANAGAAACLSNVTGNWNAAATWTAGSACTIAGGNATNGPGADDTVTIANGHVITVTLAGGAQAAASIVMNGGATTTTLNLLHDLTVNGNVTISAPTSNGVTKQITVGTRTLTVTGDMTINGGTVGGTAATRTSQLTVTSGTVTIGTVGIPKTLFINAGTAATYLAHVLLSPVAGVGTITVNGDVTMTGGITANTQDARLRVTGLSNALTGVIITGNLNVNSTIATSSTVDFTGAAGGRISVGGNVTNGDQILVDAGNFTASGAGATFSTTNASVVALSHVTLTRVTSGTLTIAGNTTVTGGVVNPSGATMTVATGTITIGTLLLPRNLSITAGAINTSIATASVTGAQGLIDVKGDLTLTGSAAAGVNRNALLTVSGIGAVGRGVNIGGILTIASTAATTATAQMSGVTVGADSSRITVTGNVVNGDRIFADTGIFTANGATFATTATTNNAITRVTTGTLTIAGNATVNASTTVNSTSTMTVSTGRITVTGDLTVTGGNNAALRNALLSVTGAPAVAGNGINVDGILSTVLSTGALTSATASITAANGVVNANGNFINNGTFTNNAVAGQLFLGGATSTINGSFIRSTGTVTMDGVPPLAVTQTLSGTALTELPAANGLNNFTISNTTGFGVTLGSTVAVKATLTFTAGDITTGATNTLTMATTAPAIAGATAAQHVVGNLARVFPAVAGTSYIYTVGDGTIYTPVTITFPAAPTTGSLTVSTTAAPAGDQPNTTAGSSGVRIDRSVNRYWTVKNSSMAGTATASFTYVAGDNDGGTTPANYIIRRGYNCSGTGTARNCHPWLAQTVSGTPTNILASASGVTIAVGATAESDFSVGEVDPATNFLRERQFIYTRELY